MFFLSRLNKIYKLPPHMRIQKYLNVYSYFLDSSFIGGVFRKDHHTHTGLKSYSDAEVRHNSFSNLHNIFLFCKINIFQKIIIHNECGVYIQCMFYTTKKYQRSCAVCERIYHSEMFGKIGIIYRLIFDFEWFNLFYCLK